MEHQHANASFACALVFARSRVSGPPGEVAKPSERLKGLCPVAGVVGDLGGNSVVLAGGSKGVVIPLVEPVLVRGPCDHTGGKLDGIRGDVKRLVIDGVIIE